MQDVDRYVHLARNSLKEFFDEASTATARCVWSAISTATERFSKALTKNVPKWNTVSSVDAIQQILHEANYDGCYNLDTPRNLYINFGWVGS